jgi:cyanophycinase
MKRLGATNVFALPLIDGSPANALEIAEILAKSKLIYLLGGFPQYLAQTLNGSRSWQAILSAYLSGAVIAGSSAGAMVLGKYYCDPFSEQVVEGLNLVEHIFILPHHNTFGKDWLPFLKHQLPDIIFLGIDEETGTLSDPAQENWRVYGKGKITRYHRGRVDKFRTGQAFHLENPPRTVIRPLSDKLRLFFIFFSVL